MSLTVYYSTGTISSESTPRDALRAGIIPRRKPRPPTNMGRRHGARYPGRPRAWPTELYNQINITAWREVSEPKYENAFPAASSANLWKEVVEVRVQFKAPMCTQQAPLTVHCGHTRATTITLTGNCWLLLYPHERSMNALAIPL